MASVDRLLAPLQVRAAASERSRLIAGALIILVIATALRLYTAGWLDPFTQHDPNKQLPILRAVIDLRSFGSYNAPFYYLLVTILGAPFVALFRLHLISESAFFSLSILWSGLVLQTIYMYGCLVLARHLRFRPATQLTLVSLCIFLPPIQRSFSMLRPENLILTLTPFACIFIVVCWRNIRLCTSALDIPAAYPALGALALIAAQKVSGMFLVAGFGLALLDFTPGSLVNRGRKLLPPFGVLVGTIVVLLVVHRLMSGVWFFQHQAFDRQDYQETPEAAVFVALNPMDAWKSPFRNTQAKSMPNILLIDLFGDYWRYGSDHYRLKPLSTVARSIRARTGLFCSAVFVLINSIGLLHLAAGMRGKADPLRTLNRERLALSLIFFLGFAVLVATSVLAYKPDKFDTIKWEYIVFFLPFAMIPLSHLMDRLRHSVWSPVLRATLLVLILAGIAQSIALPFE